MRAVLPLILGLVTSTSLGGQMPGEAFGRAKQLAYDANYRNDAAGLRDAVRRFERLARDRGLAAAALYYAGWTRWVLAASEVTAGDTAAARATLAAAVRDLERALALRPDDPDTHAVLAWALVAIAALDRFTHWGEMSDVVAKHRARALALGPRNPRVMIMDAGMTFYTPPQQGGSQERGIARWLEALDVFEHEKIDDPTRPDWGGALAYGWLANLYLSMTPPNVPDARRMADKALALRPDFWWVRTQVLPKTER